MYIINFIGTKRLLTIRNITAYSAQKGVKVLSTWQEGQLGTEGPGGTRGPGPNSQVQTSLLEHVYLQLDRISIFKWEEMSRNSSSYLLLGIFYGCLDVLLNVRLFYIPKIIPPLESIIIYWPCTVQEVVRIPAKGYGTCAIRYSRYLPSMLDARHTSTY
jgi:hypothetical protein